MVNSYIGAHLVANVSDDVIDSFEAIIADPNIIPTVRKSSAAEYIVKVSRNLISFRPTNIVFKFSSKIISFTFKIYLDRVNLYCGKRL